MFKYAVQISFVLKFSYKAVKAKKKKQTKKVKECIKELLLNSSSVFQDTVEFI